MSGAGGKSPGDLFKRLPEIVMESMRQALEAGLKVAMRRMEPGGGGPRVRTGLLKRSLKAEVRRQGNTVIGSLVADAPYAHAQEYGAVIQKKRRGNLRFKVEGRWAAARRVVLPARPFLKPGIEAAAAALEELVRENIRKELA